MEYMICKRCGIDFLEIKKKRKNGDLCCKKCYGVIETFPLNRILYYEEYIFKNNKIVSLLKADYLRDISDGIVLTNNYGNAHNYYEGIYLEPNEIIEYYNSFEPITRKEYIDELEIYSDEKCDCVKMCRRDWKKIMGILEEENLKEIKDILEKELGWWERYHK